MGVDLLPVPSGYVVLELNGAVEFDRSTTSRELDENLDSYAARRPRETAVVVLEPRYDVTSQHQSI